MSEQKQEISSSISPQLKAEAGLKRVFNVEQKSYFEKLKAEMAAIARGRTPQEMRAEKDLKSLREWVARKGKMIEFLTTKKIPESEMKKSVAEQIEMAREKLGRENVLGPEAIQKTFGIELEEEEIPEISFSEKELERAAELGQMLVLRVDKTAWGRPLSLAEMEGAWKFYYRHKNGFISLLYTSGRWKSIIGNDAFKKDAPRPGWALVSRGILAGSTSKNPSEQIEVIIKYLQDSVFSRVKMPKEYVDAIAEFETEKSSLLGMISKSSLIGDWVELSRRIYALKITKLTMRTAQETIYDLAVFYGANARRLLINQYAMSATLSSQAPLLGWLVYLGFFGTDGVDGDVLDVDRPYSRIGVCFSRRQ